jgi:threonine/homoserine/homoserine lactone efflux protein
VDLERLVPFLLAATLIELTPGPNMAYLSLVSVRQGRTAGLLTVVGITLGLAACLLASVAGLAEFAAAQPWAYHSLRWAGVGYLLWLALDAWRGDPHRPAGSITRAWTPVRLVWRGFLLNVLNPKALVFYISLLPGFTRPESGDVAVQGLTLGAMHLAIAVTVHGAIVAAASAASPWLVGRTQSPAVRAAFAAGLAGVAAWVVLTTRAS